ncbi:MAG: CAP domain-containing protein, partial [Coprococcus sp.]
YRVHCQTYGWMSWLTDGKTSGTTGEGKRLEAIEVKLTGNRYYGGISYRTHVQTYGWETKMVSNGAMSGTSGQAKRLEAIELELYGEVAYYYDVYYRVHAQSYGWLGWAKNGETAGTSGMAKRLEAIQIKLVPKNSDTSQFEDGKNAYIKGTPTANYSTQAQEVLAQCNAQRQANGIAALSLDPELTKAANIRAQEIATLFSHTRPDGRKCFTVLDQIGYSYWSAGENIAAGYGNSSAVMNGWMNSPGHRSNILNAGFKRLGVGYVYIPNSEYGYYWVQIFSN